MTIGIGALCKDGIVLAADQQITSANGFKTFEEKIFRMGDGKNWNAIFCYAGAPDMAKGFFGALTDHINTIPGPIDNCETVRLAIENTLLSRYSDEDIKNLQVLFGVSIVSTKQRCLYTNTAHRVGDVYGLNIIGCGDSSVLHYLKSRFAGIGNPSAYQAMWIAVNLVGAAKKWIEGCGGQTNLRLLRDTVTWEEPRVAQMERTIESLESLHSNVMSDLLGQRDPKHFDVEVNQLSNRLREEYTRISNDRH